MSSAGIKRVSTPSAVALTHITFATFPIAASLLWTALFHIFPERAKRVMAIMRIDQMRGLVESRDRSVRKSEGAIRRKSADAPKTRDPLLRVVRSAG